MILTCTSGSAATHFYPAVVEASASSLPLVILAADRPPELHRCGAPQAMAQDALFGEHVRDSGSDALDGGFNGRGVSGLVQN